MNTKENKTKSNELKSEGPDLSGYTLVSEGGRSANFFWISAIATSYTNKTPGMNFSTIAIGNSKDEESSWTVAISNILEYKKFAGEFLSNPKKLMDLENAFFKSKDLACKIITEKSYTIEKLSELFECIQIATYYAAVLRFMDKGLQQYFENVTCLGLTGEKLTHKLGISKTPSYLAQEEIDTLKECKNNNANNDKNIQKSAKLLYDKYSHITLGYHNELQRDIEFYKEHIKTHKSDWQERLKAIEHKLESAIVEREKYYNSLSSEQKIVANILSKIIEMKDSYKFNVNIIIKLLDSNLFEMLSKKYSIKDIKEIKNYSFEEIINLISKNEKVKEEILQARKKRYVMIGGLQKPLILYGKDADSYESQHLKINTSISILKGRTACKGNAKGKAIIVLGHKHFNLINNGDIIVVRNTSPDYTPILKKVSAVIAEDGGLTAHVSVISRELNIPCIVGVQHATSIITNGDMLEVDADNGIIKILK